MKTSEISEALLGKRVKGSFTGLQYEGIIIGIVTEHDNRTGNGAICTKGVKVRLDHPIQWGDSEYEEIESTARTMDEFGNLHYTELI